MAVLRIPSQKPRLARCEPREASPGRARPTDPSIYERMWLRYAKGRPTGVTEPQAFQIGEIGRVGRHPRHAQGTGLGSFEPREENDVRGRLRGCTRGRKCYRLAPGVLHTSADFGNRLAAVRIRQLGEPRLPEGIRRLTQVQPALGAASNHPTLTGERLRWTPPVKTGQGACSKLLGRGPRSGYDSKPTSIAGDRGHRWASPLRPGTISALATSILLHTGR